MSVGGRVRELSGREAGHRSRSPTRPRGPSPRACADRGCRPRPATTDGAAPAPGCVAPRATPVISSTRSRGSGKSTRPPRFVLGWQGPAPGRLVPGMGRRIAAPVGSRGICGSAPGAVSYGPGIGGARRARVVVDVPVAPTIIEGCGVGLRHDLSIWIEDPGEGRTPQASPLATGDRATLATLG